MSHCNTSLKGYIPVTCYFLKGHLSFCSLSTTALRMILQYVIHKIRYKREIQYKYIAYDTLEQSILFLVNRVQCIFMCIFWTCRMCMSKL